MQSRSTSVLTLVFVLVFAACTITPPRSVEHPDDDDVKHVPPDDVVEGQCTIDLAAHLDDLGVPGAAAAIVKDGTLACTAAAGMANIEENRPVTEDTIFAWASVSKTVTATAAMQLFEDGEFGLDDDINDYLPFTVETPDCPGTPITFRQLLTHTSSIIDSDVYDTVYTVGDSPIALGDFVEDYLVPGGQYYSADNYDYDCAGTWYEYSNVAVGTLGYLVEVISGQPFDDYVYANVFEPLGMTESSFLLANLDESHVAMPYDGTPGSFQAHGHVGYPTLADGSMRTSVTQLANFLTMTIEGGTYDGVTILQPSTVEEMRRRQIPTLDNTQGLIWFYYFDDKIGHDGSDPGTASYMFYDPDEGTGVILVANGDWWENGEAWADAIMNALFEEALTY